MPPKPGNLNPDSQAGNARLGTGRGPNAGRSQPSGASRAVPAPKKFTPPAGIKTRPVGYKVYKEPGQYGKEFTQTSSGRWLGNRVPDKPLSYYEVNTPIKVTNTNTGTSAVFGRATKEEAIKRFLESEPVYAKLTQGFSAAIKKAK